MCMITMFPMIAYQSDYDIVSSAGKNPPNLKTGPGFSDLMKPFKGAWMNKEFIQHWTENMKNGEKTKVLDLS